VSHILVCILVDVGPILYQEVEVTFESEAASDTGRVIIDPVSRALAAVGGTEGKKRQSERTGRSFSLLVS